MGTPDQNVHRRPARWTPEPDFAVPGAGYVSLRARIRSGFVRATCGDVEIGWPRSAELDQIVRWSRRGDVHLPLGFPRPPNEKALRRGWLPDLAGGFEPVELLSVRRRPGARLIGFLVVYEHRGSGRPHLELDVAIPDAAERGRRRVLSIKTAVMTYLFVLRGGLSVVWTRRKRVGVDEWGRPVYGRRGRRIVTDRETFRRFLEKRRRRSGLSTLEIAPS